MTTNTTDQSADGFALSASGEHMPTPNQRLLASWDANAAAWMAAVRELRIPSRRAGTDAAIVQACLSTAAATVLDVGCGEGWLARALADAGRDVVGIDASAGLVERAAATALEHGASGGRARYLAVGYDELITDRTQLPGPWELIVCNFALLGDPLTPLLSALARRLAPNGRLLIQTVHPWLAMGDARYENAWREEDFQGFGVAFPSPMPWYFRTLGSWIEQLTAAGLSIRAINEPVQSETGRPLSLLLECALSV